MVVVVVSHHNHQVVGVVDATVEVTAACVDAVVAGAGAVVLAAAVLTGANDVGARVAVLVDRGAVVLARPARVVVEVAIVPAAMVPAAVAELDGAFVTSTPSTWTPTAAVVGTEPTLPTLTVSGRCGRNAKRPTTTATSNASASSTSARCRGSGRSRRGTAPIVAVDAPATADSGPAQPMGSSTRSV